MKRLSAIFKNGKSLVIFSMTSVLFAIFVWTLLFYNNPYLDNALIDIHVIFVSVLVVYFLIRSVINDFFFDFIKVFTRTLFRVWLLIFITFAISQSMKRVGIVLSITFIFGYFEGLMDIDKWLSVANPFRLQSPTDIHSGSKKHALSVIMLMSWIHVLCALVVKLFSLFVGELI